MTRALRSACFIAALAAPVAALAADKPCTKADAANAQKTLDRASSWPQMQKAWQDFRHCDADATKDQFTDSLMRLLVDWKHVEALAAAMQKDAEFKSFVHAHLQSPAAKDDIQDVYARAKSNCPKGLDAFCAELADIAKPKK
jgi:hypothetical protein